MQPLGAKVYLLKRYSLSDSFCTFFFFWECKSNNGAAWPNRKKKEKKNCAFYSCNFSWIKYYVYTTCVWERVWLYFSADSLFMCIHEHGV